MKNNMPGKKHPKDRRRLRSWLLWEIGRFLSGKIASGEFDDAVFGKKHRSLIVGEDVTCYDTFYWFWQFYDDFKDRPWSELFDPDDEHNAKTRRMIGDFLVLLTSDFEYNDRGTGLIRRLKSLFQRRKQEAALRAWPFRSESERTAAWQDFALHREKYVPGIIPQSVYEIYIKPSE